MPNPKKSLVFFGNERLATGVATEAPTLQALIKAGYDVFGAISNYNESQSRNLRTLEIKEMAEKNNIPIWIPQKTSEIKSELEDLGAEFGVLAAYGKIVPQAVIDIFPRGIINIHPSLLPLHRGPIPIESVILEGATKTGVSLMQLVKDMDAGPVFGQAELILHGSETKQQLADSLLEIGGSMLIELLPGILDGTIVPLPQDNSRATYDQLITKADGLIDWQKPAEQLGREIRAFAGWPQSYTKLGDLEVIITKARVMPINHPKKKPGDIEASKVSELMVHSGSGCLCIERLKPIGKREMSAAEFINGYGQRLKLF